MIYVYVRLVVVWEGGGEERVLREPGGSGSAAAESQNSWG